MKYLLPPSPRSTRAFTLIELLIVIAIIAVLAGLIFSAMPGIKAKQATSVAKSELTQITTAIEAYKARYGSYPPDSPTNVFPANPLYFELTGMVISGNSYKSLDGSYEIPINTVTNGLKVPGLVNASTTAAATDDHPAIETFLKQIKPDQITTNNGVRVLTCSVDDTAVWRYNSSNPTNNPGSYDLWVDLVFGGKTNRISNWSR
ncbi:MAG TPA: type II secretion system protein [Verrucomicrobiae bacterium]|nr:type II secretion system protein [Verrucomicrobiae bacterium]